LKFKRKTLCLLSAASLGMAALTGIVTAGPASAAVVTPPAKAALCNYSNAAIDVWGTNMGFLSQVAAGYCKSPIVSGGIVTLSFYIDNGNGKAICAGTFVLDYGFVARFYGTAPNITCVFNNLPLTS
jgi:hypothetical protein